MIIGLLAALLAGPAIAAPGVIPIQGQVADSAGVLVDGSVEVTFRIYGDASAAEALFTETLSVVADQGRFAVRLGGNGTALELGLFSTHPQATLTFQITGDTESADIPLDAVPYAAWAGDAGSLEGSTLDEILDEIPTAEDIDARAAAVCFDNVGELTAVLDGQYLAADYEPSWAEIAGIPAGLVDGVDGGFTTEGELTALLDDVYLPLDYSPDEAALTSLLDSVYLPVSYVPAWEDLADVPDDFADGVDNDTQYTVGMGLRLDDTELSLEKGPLIPHSDFAGGDLTGWTVETGAGTVEAVPDGPPSGFVFRNQAASDAWFSSTERVPVKRGANYRVSGSFRRVDPSGVGGTMYLVVRAFNSSGANLGSDGGAWYYYPVNLEIPNGDTAWRTYTAEIGPDYAKKIADNVSTISVGAILNYNYGAGNTRIYEVANLQLEEVEGPSTLTSRSPTLLNSWVNYGNGYAGAGFVRDAAGVVHLQGMISGGTINQDAFVLPAGYRPNGIRLFSTLSNDQAARVDVYPNGVVRPVTGNSAWISLDGLSFSATQ